MAPWLLLALALAQSADPYSEDAQRAQQEAQSVDGTLDGGTSSTGAPDPNAAPGTGGSGVPLPGAADAGLPAVGVDAGAPYTVPSPFPDGGTSSAADPRFAPGTGSTAPGSTGPTPPAPPAGSDSAAPPPLDTGRARPGLRPSVDDDDDSAAAADTVDASGAVVMGAMEIEGPASAATPEEAAAALRDQVQALEEREQALVAQQRELAERTRALEEQVAEAQERAQALEAARQERLAALEDVSGLLLDADTALEAGDGDVEDRVSEALELLAQVADSAEASGQGDAALVTDRARYTLSGVNEAIGRRDYYFARLALQFAAESVRSARRDTLERNEGALLQEGGAQPLPVEPGSEPPPVAPGY